MLEREADLSLPTDADKHPTITLASSARQASTSLCIESAAPANPA